jgi:hypothetical protein
MVQSQHRQIVHETLSQKKKTLQERTGRVAQGIGPQFKPQYCKKKRNLDTDLTQFTKTV